jgi:hypothetical protein
MAAQPLVYVHGAGVQAPAPAMKHELDHLLFGRDMSTTRVAHYADVRWPPAGGGQRSVGPERSGRTRRSRAIGAATKPGVSSKTAAAVLLGATLATPSPARGPRDRTRAAAGASEEPTAPPADAFHLVEQLYRRADRVATHSAAPRASAERGLGFPDPIFRWVVGRFASDVIDYLFNGYNERMRQPVRDALLNGPPPAVIVAHSLGTIVTYDVLAEPAFAGLQVHLITLGCPLGIGNVQERLRDGAGRPNPVPPSVIAWANFADSWDPVAIDPTLHDEFTPNERSAKDDRVNNPARNNHDLNGYLSVAMVRSTIVTAAG